MKVSNSKVNKGSKDRYAELWEEWKVLKAEGRKTIERGNPIIQIKMHRG